MRPPTEAQIRTDLMMAGEDPDDALARQVYLDALKATQPHRERPYRSPEERRAKWKVRRERMRPKPDDLLPDGRSVMGAFKDATHMSAMAIADALGCSRQAVEGVYNRRQLGLATKADLEILHKLAAEQLVQIQLVMKLLEDKHRKALM